MRIAIDALGIGNVGGGRSATMNLLQAMLPLDSNNHYLLLLDRPEPELALGDHIEQIIVPVRQRFACRVYAGLVWPALLRHKQVNLVHHVKNLSTPGLPGRRVVTIYDMTILVHPELYPAIDVWYWRHRQGALLREADRVIAISHHTAGDLQKYYQLDPQKIRVIYPAYSPRFTVISQESAEKACTKYGVGERFILHVGNISRKKNLLLLVKAYERLANQGYAGKLVLAGAEYNKGHDDALFEHISASPLRERIVFTGRIPDDDLPALYHAAELMVFPSLHEGFGIAPIEAMACGTPVITSSGGALPEVIGDAGIVLADLNEDTLYQAMAHLLNDSELRSTLRTRGLVWVKRYSQQETAERTLAVYHELLG